MRIALKIGLASVLVAVCAGVPWVLLHHAQLELRARRNALEEQARRLTLLVADNERLAGLVAQAVPPLTEEQLRELMRLRGDAGRRSADGRPGEGSTVRVYGFSDGRVVEVSSEDGRFDDWEKQHMNSAPAGTEEKIYLESEENARERARMVEDGASLGI